MRIACLMTGPRVSLAVLAWLGATASAAVGQTAARSSAQDRTGVTITVYNQDFGLVRERRTLNVATGRVALEFGDVASAIQPETVHIRSVRGGGIRVLEQNYQYDLLNPQKLLEKYVGRTVKVYRPNSQTGLEDEFDAEVLSVNQGVVLRIGDEITYNVPGRFAFPEIPENLIAQPTLVWLLQNEEARQDVEVSYLTQGLNWKADYVLVVDENDAAGDLTGWVTLTNQSGASFTGANLKLVAGDVQRVTPEMARQVFADQARMRAQVASEFQEQAFFEYHLYTLQRATDLRHNEQKQVTLLEGSGIGVEKQLIFYGAAQYYRGSYGQVVSNQKVGVYLDFQNTEANRLGMPLPKGIVRVYKSDPDGSQQFIGEDRIDHTPRDERVRIKMGEAFDVVGDRRQMDYTVLNSCMSESTWEVQIRNHKDEMARVQLIEPAGGDWELLSSSHPFTRMDAHTFRYTIDVPARGETTVRYRIRVRWC